MRTARASIVVFSALASLPLAAPGSAADCGAEIQQMAQQHHLSLSPAGPTREGSSAAEAPATTESRGLTAGPDSLSSSGGTLPPSTSAPPAGQRDASSPQLGAADRAKVEGLLAEARSAGEQGRGQDCRQRLDEARALLRQGRE